MTIETSRNRLTRLAKMGPQSGRIGAGGERKSISSLAALAAAVAASGTKTAARPNQQVISLSLSFQRGTLAAVAGHFQFRFGAHFSRVSRGRRGRRRDERRSSCGGATCRRFEQTGARKLYDSFEFVFVWVFVARASCWPPLIIERRRRRRRLPIWLAGEQAPRLALHLSLH